MTERLPIFALGTVLYPGLVLPLHVFEARYRAMVADRRTEGTFGVVAIKSGGEVADSAAELYDVGCLATIRRLVAHDDGRFDLVTVGGRRFRIARLDREAEPYLTADVEWLDADETEEVSGDAAERLVPGILDLFQRYLTLIRTDGVEVGEQMPDEPTVLSYAVAATMVLPIDERQALLAHGTTRERLAAERRLLNRENALLATVRALPLPVREFAVEPSAN